MPLAPKVVLPKTSTVRLTRNLKKKARASYPNSHYQKAMYFKQKGDKSRALVEFLKATQENPRLTKAFYEQALIFRDRGYLKLAQSSLEQALALKPDFTEGRMLLATVQIQQGNVGGAMQQLGQSLGISVATKGGDKIEEDEFPPPTVLQSLHTLLPENIANGVSRLTVGQTTAATKAASKTLSKAEQKTGARNKNRKVAQQKIESADKDTVQILEPKTATADANSVLGLHMPNPLHMLFPESKLAETRTTAAAVKDETVTASLDAANLPALPPDESKSESHETTKKVGEKASRRSKKNWFSRFMTALETPQDDANEAPPAPPPITEDDDNDKPGAADVRSIPPLKSEQASDVPAQIETFEKPDQPKQIIEKVAALANAAISGVGKTPFQIPNLPTLGSSMFNTHSGSATTGNDAHAPQTADEQKPYKPVIAPNSDDPWSVRLRYLADHGTGTLKDGEAFMFSEESGEATLFLSDGQTVRRTIYLPRDAQEVVKQRRPDILTPDDLLYNLSLLAKLMPKANEQEQPTNIVKTEQPSTQPAFAVNDLMGKSQSFWGWMKSALKLQ
ncbi:MAG: hypothetical protein JST89_11170 [Cyanobacteria bacterium SZAS-4]|nr:hypothetical protein [Cyanobacteria bacterium SZAS-4]